jgi:hypothetical protein
MLFSAPNSYLKRDQIDQNAPDNKRLTLMRDNTKTLRGPLAKEVATPILCRRTLADNNNQAGRGNP